MLSKKSILVLIAIIAITVVVIAPIVPVESIATYTRTVKLRYSSEVYGLYNVPKIVNVTNKDSIGGSFSVSMNMWYNNPAFPLSGPQRELEASTTQSSFINPGSTQTFLIPEDWIVIEPMYSFTYSVVAPTKQENYNLTETEYKSILELVAESVV